jgi:uncharacterized membrane protein YidH (DUF202 family)
MQESSDQGKPRKPTDRRDRLANERTFLAWVRTSISIMAFGFVVEKFALFIKRLPYLFGEAKNIHQPPASSDWSSIFGIILVAMGAMMGLLAFARYKKIEQEIDEDTYQPSLMLDILLGLGILSIGIFLVFYMLHSM